MIYEKKLIHFSMLLSGISHIKATIAYNKIPISERMKENVIPKM